MSRTTVIIPNYNGAAFIGPCLRSLVPQCGADVRVLVVDNGSEDGSDQTAEAFTGVEVLRLGENTGFTGAVNAGVLAAKDSEYVILLNNDTVAGKHFVSELIAAMDRHPDAFSAQARMRTLRDPKILDGAGDIYSVFGWAFERGKGAPAGKYAKEEPVFCACAGAAIYRTDIFLALGGLDPAYFAYLEDVDLGWRAKRAGWKNYYAPAANVLHAGSGTTGSRVNTFKVDHSSRNNIYLLRKNMPLRYRALFFPTLLAGFLIKTVYFTLKGHGRTYVKGLMKGFFMKMPAHGGDERLAKIAPDPAFGAVKDGADRAAAKEILGSSIRCGLEIVYMHLALRGGK